MLGKFFKKYGKHLASFAILMVLVLPLAANQASAAIDVKKELTASGLDTSLSANANLPQFIGNIIEVVLGVLGLILVVLIVYAGFIWTTAQGDTVKVKKAQDMIKQAVIGMIIVFAAYAITSFVLDNLQSVADNSNT